MECGNDGAVKSHDLARIKKVRTEPIAQSDDNHIGISCLENLPPPFPSSSVVHLIGEGAEKR